MAVDIRVTDRSPLRCPWCLAPGAPGQAGWITCPRDQTPVHAACVREFGICPICREALDEEPVTTASGAVRAVRLGPELGAGRSSPGPLPDELRSLVAAIRRQHGGLLRRGWVLGPLLLAAFATAWAVGTLWLPGGLFLATGAAAGGVLLRLMPVRPRAARLLPSGAPPGAHAVAERVAQGDRTALRYAALHRHARREARRVEAAEAALDRRVQAAYRRHLEAATPIEDAQRIRGIGPGITAALRQAGVATLADLRGRDLTQVRGIGPQRSLLLQSWWRERRAAIERLARAGRFPGREAVDRRFAGERGALDQRRAVTRAKAGEAEAALAGWAAERPGLNAALGTP